MENPRTTSARDHDDGALIDEAETAPAQGGRSGGNLAGDVATRDELAEIDDPEHRTRVTKARAIEYAREQRIGRARAADAEELPEQPPRNVG